MTRAAVVKELIMTVFLDYIKAFVVGGALCMIGQLLIDRTKWTPARILVTYVVSGVVLSALGLYGRLVDWAGAGASVPLTGFGNLLAEGVRKGVKESGFMGIFTGAVTAAAAGITAAVFFGFACSLFARPKDKK